MWTGGTAAPHQPGKAEADIRWHIGVHPQQFAQAAIPLDGYHTQGVAGTMAANGSGVQMSTLRSLALAWVLTLPCAIGLSAFLFFVFSHLF